VTTNIAGYDFRLIASSNAIDCGIGIEPTTGETALVYGYTNSGATNLTAMEISSNDNKFFDLHSVDITIDGLSSGTSQHVRLLGYRGGTPVAGALLDQTVTSASFGGVLVTFNVAANSNFVGVDKIRIETDGSYAISGAIGVDNINATNFRSVLPISLVSFNAGIQKNTAILDWRMVSEVNSSNFIIERSADGINFNPIGKVAAGNNNVGVGVAEYTFIDEHPMQGANYYRIKLVEAIEEERYLGVRKLNFAFNNTIALYPNPVTGSSVTLQTGAAIDKKVMYVITDLSGNTIASGTVTSYLQQIDVAQFTKGLYLLRLTDGSGVKFQKQ
jgi:hypothetical protein